MRRPQLLALVAAVLLVVGVGVVVARNGDETPSARRTPAPTPTPTATGKAATKSPAATPARTVSPSPAGKGPRDREFDVVYAAGVTPNDGAFAVAEAGGVIVKEVPAVGVVTVRAPRDFLTRARKDDRIHGVVPNRAVGLPPEPEPNEPPFPGNGTERSGSGQDPLADLQWDMALLNTARAHRVEDGDRRVLVAVIDTGVDRRHPDIAKAYDTKLSRNFVTDYPGADGPCEERDCTDPVGVDPGGHGTHVAGTIVAAADGFGMAGVAPGVRLVDLRAGQDSGFFFLMPTVQALTYAADIGVDVANMSFFVDPWLFNCPNSPDDSKDEQYEQRALIEGVKRAVEYAHSRGVTLVAAAGNEHLDMDRPSVDEISPDFPKGNERTRRVDASCHVLPTTLPQVIQVSSLGRDRVKADYSNYGGKHIAVTAPGGSSQLADGTRALENQTLSAYPEQLLREEGVLDGADPTPRDPGVVSYCRGDTCGYYRWLVGTSMASPHAAGVAALIVSRYGRPDPNHAGQLTMRPASVERILTRTARPLPCPDPPTVRYGRGFEATCRVEDGRTNFYGAGLVDALAAVTRR